MERHLKSTGKPYAKGGPASKRKAKAVVRAKPLRQSKLSSRAVGATAVAGSQSISQHEEDSGGKKNYFRPISDDDPTSAEDANIRQPQVAGKYSPEPAALKSASVDMTETVPKTKSNKKHVHQSRINFQPGGDRFISTDPVDSEDEEFRGTQFVAQKPKTSPTPQQPDSERRRRSKRASPSMSSDGEPERRSQLEPQPDAHQPSVKTPARSEKITRRSRPARAIELSDSEDDLVTPLRRRKRFMPSRADSDSLPSRSQEFRSSQVEEARSEARDLDHKLIKTTKYRQANTKKNAFKSNLERLRRKKAGLPLASENEEEEEEEEGEEDDDVGPASAARDDPKDWIVEDDMDRGQILDDLPQEFQQPRQPMEQFKIAVQWEILDLLMPQGGFEPDAYFKPAINWLRDRTSGKSQAAISSIWRRPFVKALQRGPDLDGLETGNLGAFCDACGRTNRIATYVVQFQGPRYDHMTLEDLASDASSSEDDLDIDANAASDPETERARKERILRAEWNLGVNCYERTCVAHELFHLRKHLREEIYAKLHALGLFSAAKKVERSVLSKSRRIEFANRVTEQLDASRFQQRLWSRYKATIERNEEYIVDPNAGRKRGRYV